MQRLTIIVTNYNYERFLRAAIDSALAVDWSDKEVIVVDDGSTDRSQEIIASYGDRIIAIVKANGGQRSAANFGFARASGDVVIFLDADDLLFPVVAHGVMPFFEKNAVSKVQFSQKLIDAEGRPVSVRQGMHTPVYTEAHTPAWCRRTLFTTGYYDTPPTSGIAWSSNCLQKIFPLAVRDRTWPVTFFDAYLSMIAPLMGDVYSVPTPLGAYRIHLHSASNRMDIMTGLLTVENFFARTAVAANQFLENVLHVPDRINLQFNELHMRRHLAKIATTNRLSISLLLQYARAVSMSELNLLTKLLSLIWATSLMIAPASMAERLVRLRFDPKSRSKLFNTVTKVV